MTYFLTSTEVEERRVREMALKEPEIVALVKALDKECQGKDKHLVLNATITWLMFMLEAYGISKETFCNEILSMPMPSEIIRKEKMQEKLPGV